jgi:hypothetical protein
MSEVESGEVKAPDERSFLADLERESFAIGVSAGRWRLDELEWPGCVISVAAARRDNAPSEFSLKFDLTGYPAQAPTATPWDRTSNQQLDSSKLPRGRRAGHVFRRDGWMGGRALYAPYDRVALPGHPDWLDKFPELCWQPNFDITFYLEQVYDLLHDPDYAGV